MTAQRIEAGTDETPQEVRPEGQEPDPKDAPRPRGNTTMKTASTEREAIVGHKTMTDGTHAPLHADEAAKIWEQIEAEKAIRHEQLPDLRSCLKMLGRLSERMRELGWQDAIYCPKDGSLFEVIEFGSTGIHVASYEGKWPKGSWWTYGGGDMWPSRPILWRPLSEGQDGCTIPPDGWFCTRVKGHEGPCAAIERRDHLKDQDHGRA